MNKINRIFITGCGGMLGSAIYPYFKDKGYSIKATDIDVNESWLDRMDVRDFNLSREMIKSYNPDIVLHLAALTNIEYCEANLENANSTNFLGTRNMALICKEMNIPLVYISTAGVFDGKAEEYRESDIPNPINIYGRTKLYGEVAVENLLDKYFIVRAGWMVGGGKKDKKFASYMLSQIKEGKTTLDVVNDTQGTLTYTSDFARNLELLINTEFYGKYHMACSGKATRADIAREILGILKRDDVKVNEVDSSHFSDLFPIQRANCEVLINQNLISKGINIMRPWQVALKDYVTLGR